MVAYNRAPNPGPVVAFVTFYKGLSKAFETAPLTAVSAPDGKSRIVPLRFGVSLGSLPPGEYTCQVTVLSPDNQNAAFWHAPVMLIP